MLNVIHGEYVAWKIVVNHTPDDCSSGLRGSTSSTSCSDKLTNLFLQILMNVLPDALVDQNNLSPCILWHGEPPMSVFGRSSCHQLQPIIIFLDKISHRRHSLVTHARNQTICICWCSNSQWHSCISSVWRLAYLYIANLSSSVSSVRMGDDQHLHFGAEFRRTHAKQ